MTGNYGVVEADGQPGPQVLAGLQVETALGEVQLRSFKAGKARVDIESSYICLLCEAPCCEAGEYEGDQKNGAEVSEESVHESSLAGECGKPQPGCPSI